MAAREQSRLRIRTLGPTEIELGPRQVLTNDWPSARVRSLFLLLLATPGYRLTNDQVIDELWPELDPEAGRNALYKTIHALRRTFEPDLRSARDSRFVQTGGGTISLLPGSISWHDTEVFERNLEAAARAESNDARVLLRQALALYRGDFAADERYADWPVPRREALRQARHRATQDLARRDLDAGSAGQTIPLLEALVASEPDAEDAYRALMSAYEALGQRELALREFERCRQALNEHLGLDPSRQTRELAERIRASQFRHQPDVPKHQRAGTFNNLPALPTPTIGRTAEIDRLYDLVHGRSSRLVTVLGTGGIGKTRLALEAGAELAHVFKDGVAFVTLASVREPARLFDTIARTLNLEPDPRRDMDDVVLEALEHREQLLILDNFEHIIDAAGDVARLLEQCRNLRVLITSREPLRIRAEQVFRLEPLDIPSLDEDTSPRSLARNDAAALLLQSIRAHTPDFEVTTANATVIAQLCARLEGLPLAIEIAAARCLDVTPESVLGQLDERMHALRDGPRDLPPRHRALRNTILWSYQLLSLAEQSLFRRLGVFAGGVELDALDAIGGPQASSVARALVDKSLATWTLADGVPRLGMLESIRDFAIETLAAVGELPASRAEHATFLVDVAHRAEPELLKPGRIDLYRRLDRDLPNIREALRFLIDDERNLAATALAGNLGAFWYTRGHVREGLEWLRAVLAGAGEPPVPGTAEAHYWAGLCADSLGESLEATRLMTQARDLAERAGDQDSAGRATAVLGLLAFRGGRFMESHDLHQRARSMLDPGQSPWASAFNLAHLARTIGVLGDDPLAISTMSAAIDQSDRVEEGLQVLIHLYAAQILFDVAEPGEIRLHVELAERLARLTGHARQLALARYTSARLLEIEGDLALASDAVREAIALFDASHDRRGGAIARLVLARITLRDSIDPLTVQHIRAAVMELQSTADVSNLLAVQLTSAMMALHLDDHSLALALVESARNLVASRGAVMAPTYADNFLRVELRVESGLRPADRDAARSQGVRITDQELFHIALDLCTR